MRSMLLTISASLLLLTSCGPAAAPSTPTPDARAQRCAELSRQLEAAMASATGNTASADLKAQLVDSARNRYDAECGVPPTAVPRAVSTSPTKGSTEALAPGPIPTAGCAVYPTVVF